MSVLALDWDGTLTHLPRKVSEALVTEARAHNIVVVIVTNRHPHQSIPDFMGLPVVYAAGQPKRAAARAAGYEVLWWLDDMPVLVDFGEAGLSAI